MRRDAAAAGRGAVTSFGVMPRVVSDQRRKFLNDELFRKLSRESEVRWYPV